MNNEKQIAQTIINQLGGFGRLQAMLGATNFAHSEDGLITFKFKMCKKANHIKISLNSSDLYDIEFIKIWGTKIKTTQTYNNIYCDQLREIFEDYTGLYLSL